jgi:thiol-disulfide isomerase/thioredoxin
MMLEYPRRRPEGIELMDGTVSARSAFLRAASWWRRRAALCLLALALGACNKEGAEPQLVEGQAFPAFMLDFITGGNDGKRSLQGKMLVLNVWATWCPPCRREMPGLESLSKTLDPKRFAVIGLSTDKDPLLATEFIEQNGISFANFLDQNGKMSRRLGLQVYPETFVIAADGTLLRRMTGLHDWGTPEMAALMERLYQGH